MNDTLQSILAGTAGLSVIALVSIAVAFTRDTVRQDGVKSIQRICYVGVILHFFHFIEEAVMGFHLQFPALLDLVPWPLSFFIVFNFAWVVIWIVSIQLVAVSKLAVGALWFLAIASLVNGLFHPAVALLLGDYFPGLYTSLLVGILGGVLVKYLCLYTARRR